MVCGKCWRGVSGGVVDGDANHPHYRRGRCFPRLASSAAYAGGRRVSSCVTDNVSMAADMGGCGRTSISSDTEWEWQHDRTSEPAVLSA